MVMPTSQSSPLKRANPFDPSSSPQSKLPRLSLSSPTLCPSSPPTLLPSSLMMMTEDDLDNCSSPFPLSSPEKRRVKLGSRRLPILHSSSSSSSSSSSDPSMMSSASSSPSSSSSASYSQKAALALKLSPLLSWFLTHLSLRHHLQLHYNHHHNHPGSQTEAERYSRILGGLFALVNDDGVFLHVDEDTWAELYADLAQLSDNLASLGPAHFKHVAKFLENLAEDLAAFANPEF